MNQTPAFNLITICKIVIAVSTFASCTAIKPSISEPFERGSTMYHVKGLQGWMVNQRLSFGPYRTSAIQRGWDYARSLQFTKFKMSPEESILKVFDINTDKHDLKRKSRFQYTLEDTSVTAEIYGTEQFSEKQLVYKSNNPYIGDASKDIRYEYSFAAAIVPLPAIEKRPWSLVMISRYDSHKDTARKLFDKPYVEEEGYATDGTETIAIMPLRLKSGLLSGYELQIEKRPAAVVDILNGNIRIHNDLPSFNKLILSSAATAILVRRMQQAGGSETD